MKPQNHALFICSYSGFDETGFAYSNEGTNQDSSTMSEGILHNEWRFPRLEHTAPRSQCQPGYGNTHSFHISFSRSLSSPFSCLVTTSLILSFLLLFLNTFSFQTSPPTLSCRYLPHPPTLFSLLHTSFYHLHPGSAASFSRYQLMIFCEVQLFGENSLHSARV